MRLFIVDAFADQPFTGNPAAICLLDEPRDAAWMQQVAAEMNLSETAYLSPQGAKFELRWFTPAIEVELCGHATLASAHVLWSETDHTADQLHFQTKSGILSATRSDAVIELDFPATPAVETEPPAGLLEALGVQPAFVGQSKYDKFVVVDREETIRSLKPDFQRLGQVPMRGVIVTSLAADSRFDFISRYFAPAAGVNEDPVTGSAHCCLAPYWAEQLGKTEMTGLQTSSRGGIVRVRCAGGRVILGGTAVTMLRGELSERCSSRTQ